MSSGSVAEAPRSAYVGIFLCSLGVLMLEVLLTRVFSFTIWYHLAYLTISTALLGFGAAGSLLAAVPKLLQGDIRKLCGLTSAGAGILLLLTLCILAPRPIDPQQLLVQPVSFVIGLLLYYLAVTVPFFLAGIAISAPIAAYPVQVNRIYGADLLGAGLGCAGAVLVLSYLDGPSALVICATVLILAGAVYAAPGKLAVYLFGLAILVGCTTPYSRYMFDFQPTASKQEAKTLADPKSELIFSRWSPINRVDVMVMGNPYLTWWAGIGRPKDETDPGPRGLAIQYDGDNGSTVYEVKGPDSLRFLDNHFLRLPYLIKEKPRVMIIGVGGGVDILNAQRREARSITAVELQPITVELLKGKLADWTGKQFLRPELNLVAAEGRHYVRSTKEIFDLIQITATDTFSAQSTGAYVLAESYLYTVEAYEDYLRHLDDDGVLSIVLGDIRVADPSVPWPLATRLTLVGRQALENLGAKDPAAHLMLIGQEISYSGTPQKDGTINQIVGSAMSNLLVKKSPFTPEQIATYREFAERCGFVVRLMPGDKTEAPMAHLINLPGPELKEALSGGDFSMEALKDDKPFFFHVLRWKVLFSGAMVLWSFPGSTTGLLMLLIMLAQALLLGTVLILLPLMRGARGNLPAKQTVGFLLYFLALGLGFMFVEISFVQKYVLLLGYPTYSLSVTIFSLLVFASYGAWLSKRWWATPKKMLMGLLVATIALVGLEIVLLPLIREWFLAQSLPVRIVMTVLLQLPLGTCLGMYFPTGIAVLREREPRLVPWAWAVNGVASVVSSVLAVILAMSIGFSGVAILATCIYVVGTAGMLSVLSAPKATAGEA